MSLLGFKKQFAGPVERREKRQSIRAKVNGHQVGRPIQLYTGLRTKACRKLVAEDPICTSIEAIAITQGAVRVATGDNRISEILDMKAMALADGFESVADFLAFFEVAEPGDLWTGFLIKWDWP